MSTDDASDTLGRTPEGRFNTNESYRPTHVYLENTDEGTRCAHWQTQGNNETTLHTVDDELTDDRVESIGVNEATGRGGEGDEWGHTHTAAAGRSSQAQGGRAGWRRKGGRGEKRSTVIR